MLIFLQVSPGTRQLRSPFTQPLTASQSLEKERQTQMKARPQSSRILRTLSRDHGGGATQHPYSPSAATNKVSTIREQATKNATVSNL